MMLINTERLTHSLKTTIACIVALAFAKLVGLPADQWIVITVIVVMCAQLYVGGVLQKAYSRFLGTLVGCLLAATSIIAFGDTHVAIITTLALSSFLFSYIATSQESLSYAGSLGAVTTAIIMLGQKPTLLFAGERFLEISLGILIATLISQFVLPIHARTHLRHAQAAALNQLREFYATAIANTAPTHVDYQDLDEGIVQSILNQRKLAKESTREPLGEKFSAEHFMSTLVCEREILRAITFMHHALDHLVHHHPTIASLPALQHFNTVTLDTLDTFIKVITSDRALNEHIQLPDLAALNVAMHTHITERSVYIDGFLFSAEIMTNALTKLADLFSIRIF